MPKPPFNHESSQVTPKPETDIFTEGFVMSNVSTNGIDALISAMASYDVPSGAGNVVPQAVKDALAPTMANVWQETDRRMVHYY